VDVSSHDEFITKAQQQLFSADDLKRIFNTRLKSKWLGKLWRRSEPLRGPHGNVDESLNHPEELRNVEGAVNARKHELRKKLARGLRTWLGKAKRLGNKIHQPKARRAVLQTWDTAMRRASQLRSKQNATPKAQNEQSIELAKDATNIHGNSESSLPSPGFTLRASLARRESGFSTASSLECVGPVHDCGAAHLVPDPLRPCRTRQSGSQDRPPIQLLECRSKFVFNRRRSAIFGTTEQLDRSCMTLLQTQTH
jgi:hypothetical protein